MIRPFEIGLWRAVEGRGPSPLAPAPLVKRSTTNPPLTQKASNGAKPAPETKSYSLPRYSLNGGANGQSRRGQGSSYRATGPAGGGLELTGPRMLIPQQSPTGDRLIPLSAYASAYTTSANSDFRPSIGGGRGAFNLTAGSQSRRPAATATRDGPRQFPSPSFAGPSGDRRCEAAPDSLRGHPEQRLQPSSNSRPPAQRGATLDGAARLRGPQLPRTTLPPPTTRAGDFRQQSPQLKSTLQPVERTRPLAQLRPSPQLYRDPSPATRSSYLTSWPYITPSSSPLQPAKEANLITSQQPGPPLAQNNSFTSSQRLGGQMSGSQMAVGQINGGQVSGLMSGRPPRAHRVGSVAGENAQRQGSRGNFPASPLIARQNANARNAPLFAVDSSRGNHSSGLYLPMAPNGPGLSLGLSLGSSGPAIPGVNSGAIPDASFGPNFGPGAVASAALTYSVDGTTRSLQSAPGAVQFNALRRAPSQQQATVVRGGSAQYMAPLPTAGMAGLQQSSLGPMSSRPALSTRGAQLHHVETPSPAERARRIINHSAEHPPRPLPQQQHNYIRVNPPPPPPEPRPPDEPQKAAPQPYALPAKPPTPRWHRSHGPDDWSDDDCLSSEHRIINQVLRDQRITVEW